jgi:hypothetical protein
MFKSDPGFEIAIAIMIAIKNLIRINHDPIFIWRAGPWLNIYSQNVDGKKTGGYSITSDPTTRSFPPSR